MIGTTIGDPKALSQGSIPPFPTKNQTEEQDVEEARILEELKVATGVQRQRS